MRPGPVGFRAFDLRDLGWGFRFSTTSKDLKLVAPSIEQRMEARSPRRLGLRGSELQVWDLGFMG